MEIQAITGQNVGIGKVATNAKNRKQHIRNRAFLSLGREGFKRMVKENWFGLGTLLWANFYRSAKGDRKLLKKWQIGWYNAGAKDTDFWTLYHNAETGAKKRVKFVKATAEFQMLVNLQRKLINKGITGDPATAATMPVWAAVTIGLLKAISGLLLALSVVGLGKGKGDSDISDINQLANGGGLNFGQGSGLNFGQGGGGNGGNGEEEGSGLQLGAVAIPLLLIGGLFFVGDEK